MSSFVLTSDQDAEVSFITGIDGSNTLTAKNFWTWNNDHPATYTTTTYAAKWGGATPGTGGGVVTFAFDSASNWTSTEQSSFAQAFNLWSALANISFQVSSDFASANIAITRVSDGTASGGITRLYTSTIGSSQDGRATHAQVDIDTSKAGFGPIGTSFTNYGGYPYEVILHEIGHCLGLGHGGAYNSTASAATDQFGPYDNRGYTIMSYFNPTDSTSPYYTSGFNWGTSLADNGKYYGGEPTTPMGLDIVALQRIYGAPINTPLSGGQTFGYNCNVDYSIRPFFDFTVNTKPVVTLWDAGLHNTLDITGYSLGQSVDLHSGAFSSALGLSNNIFIAYGTAIDTVYTGNGGDSVKANDDGDFINTYGGADTIVGGAGADTIIGGAGIDVLTGGGAADVFRYLAWTDSTSSAPDSITDFQTGVDKIDLSAVSPTSITITQTSGAYLINAVTALGTMVISSTQAIVLSDIITGSSGLTVSGTAGNDLLTGTANNDFLYGLAGDDTLIGGPGADYLDGGAGSDTASYVTATSGLYVDLARPANSTGDAAGDTYVSIENLTGTGFADVLRGDTGSNVLRGGGGGDTLYGGGGADTFVLDSTSNPVTILDFLHGVDKIALDHAIFGLASAGSLASQGVSLVIGSAATAAGKTLLYDPSTGLISYDADGTGAGAAVVVGRIGGAQTLALPTIDLPTRSTTAPGPTTLDSSWSVVAQGDFNGDGSQDLLWRSTSGALQAWLLKNGQWYQSHTLSSASQAVIGVGDFNHDGTTDIVFAQSGSTNLTVSMIGGGYPTTLSYTVATHGSGWSVAGIGDFNHDGNADILWRNTTTGEAQIDFTNGSGVSSTQSVMTRDSSWSIAAVGDFNADGYADIVWRHSTDGQIDVSLQKNGAVFNTYTLGVHGTDWQVVGAGDFNFDLTSDLVFRNTTTGAVDGWLVSNQGYWEGSFSPGIHGPDWTPVAFSDFNGDGSTDFLWRQNSTGAMDGWHVLNGIWAGSFDPSKHGSDWVLAGTGDFNGDGVTDQLWYNVYDQSTQGLLLRNGSVLSTFSPGSHGTGWDPVGVGDFNGDHISDTLWWNEQTGAVQTWQIKNYSFDQSGPTIGSRSLDWNIAGIGDFNGDGSSDILWRNKATGAVETWLIKNNQIIGVQSPGTYNLDWDVAGVGDFNGDGVTDVLWRNHTTGQVDGWFLSNQGYWAGSFSAGSHTLDWTVAGIGDFNHDGTADILWQNTHNGQLDAWLVHQGYWAGSFSLGSVPTTWQLAGTGDFNADGTTDLVWLDTTTGQVHNWLLTPPVGTPTGGDFLVV